MRHRDRSRTVRVAHRQGPREALGHVAIARQHPVVIPGGIEFKHVAWRETRTIGRAAGRYCRNQPSVVADPLAPDFEVRAREMGDLQRRPIAAQPGSSGYRICFPWSSFFSVFIALVRG